MEHILPFLTYMDSQSHFSLCIYKSLFAWNFTGKEVEIYNEFLPKEYYTCIS